MGLAESSVGRERAWLRHLLEWADMRPFEKAHTFQPGFPQYLVKKGDYSRAYLAKLVGAARRFFDWMRVYRGCRSIPVTWLDTLRLPRIGERVKVRDVVTLEYMLEMAQAEVITLREKRVRLPRVSCSCQGCGSGLL